ncbi:MAG: A24 family peptidase [Castellaniella sp.]|uniref:prepilin peptidase n=1 Tax=Castellaniella sp. TaxID=1955812 RepID=UPI003C74BDD6
MSALLDAVCASWSWLAAGMVGGCAWWGMGLARWAQAYHRRVRAGAPAVAATLWRAALHARRQPVRWRRDGVGGVAAGTLAAGILYLQGWAGMGSLLLGMGMMSLAWLDARSGLLPDALTLPLMGAGWWLGRLDVWSAVLASLSVWAGLAILAWLYRRVRGRDGFGGGDIKCLAMLAGWLGGVPALTLLWTASLLGLLGWVCHRSRQRVYPFGPYLALATGPWLLWPQGVALLLDGLM